MKTLSYQTLKEIGYEGYLLPDAPVKILQFGEGNFLRAFVDYFVDVANEKAGFNGKITVVQPIAPGGIASIFEEQDGLYTLYLKGYSDGAPAVEKRVISALKNYINPYTDFNALLEAAENPDLRYIVSNTTEAGIVYDPTCRPEDAPAVSFPAKLTQTLYHRWKTGGAGVVILSCELIDNNGKALEGFVRRHVADWGLESEFTVWLDAQCLFCSTLVDRIVPGYPRNEAEALTAENGYVDRLLDVGELFGLWVIEGPEWLAAELPFERIGLPVKTLPDHSPYKKRKVRILNGAHTCLVPVAYLCGKNTVGESMDDGELLDFLRRAIWDEIIPGIDLPRDELNAFAEATLDRFKNPFIEHKLLTIALNSTSKMAARVLPSLREYAAKNGKIPPCLGFALAAYLAFYHVAASDGNAVFGERAGEIYPLSDSADVLGFFAENAGAPDDELVCLALAQTSFWGEDLRGIPGLAEFTAQWLKTIRAAGMREALHRLLAGDAGL